MTDFEARLAAMLAELCSTEGIAVDDADEGYLATWLTGPGRALEVIRKVAGMHLAPFMADNFHVAAGIGSAEPDFARYRAKVVALWRLAQV